jgi:hypothetical protein
VSQRTPEAGKPQADLKTTDQGGSFQRQESNIMITALRILICFLEIPIAIISIQEIARIAHGSVSCIAAQSMGVLQR